MEDKNELTPNSTCFPTKLLVDAVPGPQLPHAVLRKQPMFLFVSTPPFLLHESVLLSLLAVPINPSVFKLNSPWHPPKKCVVAVSAATLGPRTRGSPEISVPFAAL